MVESCDLIETSLRYVSFLRQVYIANCALNAIFAVTAITGNLLVLFSIWKCRLLSEPSYFLLGVLALTDLAVGIIVQPLYVLYKTSEILGMASITCVTGVATNIFGNLFSGMSFLTVTFIWVDRYLALHLHLRYKAMVTSSMYSKVITGLFMVLCLFVSFYPWKIGVAIIFSIIIVPVCLITSTVAYCKIFGILRRHVNVIHSEANLGEITDNARAESVLKYRKSVLGIVYVQVFFLVCYTPYFVALVIRTILGVSPEWKLAWNITTTVIYINSSMNPCLFCWRMKDIRSAVIKTVKGFRGPRDRSESRISRISPRDSRSNTLNPEYVKTKHDNQAQT
ncbi:trace amine-associated receptor 7f [Nematostella vectensis]|uniref:trace amine-associated receptor 7f n=1 Tax=Nematostella vectensis TaxID=45351 RepID=UPI00138FCA8D|nr:trace amine-associated receptor 7f [Nematostella vectensis]